ncbi:MAG TPA: phosphopentomutase, partial [Elusimicrobia bacterium]|nr:phosphopentomutase [Elusimicrobiota bacterium]
MAQKGRAIILMMDSFGIGGAEDAAKFGDSGADTLGHIAAAQGGLKVPNLAKLGLLKAAEASTGHAPQAGAQDGAKVNLPSKYGFMREISHGKDTSSGHWEMAGSP